MYLTQTLLLSLTLLALTFLTRAGENEDASVNSKARFVTYISYELLLDANKGEQTKNEMQRLGEQYLDGLLKEAKSILTSRFSPEEVLVSRDGELNRSITLPRVDKDLLESLYTDLTKKYSGKYLPVGTNILYISLPTSDNESVAVKVNIAGLET